MPDVNVVRRKPVLKKEPEAVKEALQVQCMIELTVRNGKGGKVAGRWALMNEAEVEVAKMRLAQEPLLLQAVIECLQLAGQGMQQGHGESITKHCLQLHARVIQSGLIDVVVEEKTSKDILAAPAEEDQKIILAK